MVFEAYLPGAGRFIDMLVEWKLAKSEDISNLEFGGNYIFTIPAVTGFQYPSVTWVRGSILGLRLDCEAKDILSSTVATLAFYVKYVFDSAGIKPTIVRVNGDGARLKSFLRCLSSVLDLVIEMPLDFEGTARGVLKLLAHSDGLVELENPIGEFEHIKDYSLYCRSHYTAWLTRMKFLKNLKPFFQER